MQHVLLKTYSQNQFLNWAVNMFNSTLNLSILAWACMWLLVHQEAAPSGHSRNCSCLHFHCGFSFQLRSLQFDLLRRINSHLWRGWYFYSLIFAFKLQCMVNDFLLLSLLVSCAWPSSSSAEIWIYFPRFCIYINNLFLRWPELWEKSSVHYFFKEKFFMFLCSLLFCTTWPWS